MQIIHHLTIDLARQLPVPPIGAVQNDANTRAVEISLLENGEPWNVPEGITAAVAFRKKDGTKGLYDTLPDGTKAVTVSGNTVTAVLAPQVLSCAGEVSAAVVFHDADLNQLATFPFTIRVAANPAAGQALSNDYYSYSTMEEVSEAVEAALAALEDSKQDFLTKAQEALQAVHDTATEDAPAIVCEASGQVISVADAADRPLQGLSIYGKTVQNGTPTPENPVPLESAGAGGSICVTVAGTNLLKPNVLTQTQNGLTLTVSEDGTITVNGNNSVNTWFNVGLVRATGTLALRPRWGQSRGETYFTFTHDGTTEVSHDADAYFTKKTSASMYIGIVVAPGNYSNFKAQPIVQFRPIVDDAFEPYREEQTLTASTPNGLPGIPVSNGGNYTDENGQQWICDEIDFARGVRVQRYSLVDLGTLQWTAWGDTVYGNTSFLGIIKCPANNTTLARALCSGFTVHTYYDAVTTQQKAGIAVSETGAVAIHTESAMTAASFTTMVQGMIFLYELATPIETPLSAEELAAYAALHSNKPNTTVFNDGGAEMRLSYVADTKTYIDNKFAAISAALLNA